MIDKQRGVIPYFSRRPEGMGKELLKAEERDKEQRQKRRRSLPKNTRRGG